MTKITLTIEDNTESQKVDCTTVFDPPLVVDDTKTEFTPAERTALLMLRLLRQLGGEVVSTETTE